MSLYFKENIIKILTKIKIYNNQKKKYLKKI